jgi:hypothetical protein
MLNLTNQTMNQTTEQLKLVAEKLRAGQRVLIVVPNARRSQDLIHMLLINHEVPKINERGPNQLRFENGALLCMVDICQPDYIRGVRYNSAFVQVHNRESAVPPWVKIAEEETWRLLTERGIELFPAIFDVTNLPPFPTVVDDDGKKQ